MMTHTTSAPISTSPFFACHCTSGSSFFTKNGMSDRIPRYDRTRKIARSELPPVPVGGGGGGGTYDPPPGGGGTLGGIELIQSPSSVTGFVLDAVILSSLFEPCETRGRRPDRNHGEEK